MLRCSTEVLAAREHPDYGVHADELSRNEVKGLLRWIEVGCGRD
jgi:hypothetical protein